MKFKTPYDKPEKVSSNPGSRFADELQLKIRDDGSYEFINTGKRDIYLEIQSHKDSCDIHWILDHFQNNPIGLAERLQQRQAEFLDSLDFPKTYSEMLQRCIDARNFFYTLDPDVRAKFNHSVDEFIAQIGTEKWNDIMIPKEVSNVEKTSGSQVSEAAEKAE